MVWGRFKTLAKKIHRRLSPRLAERPAPIPPLNNPYAIERPSAAPSSTVDGYWGNYTIKSVPYASGQELLDWLQWRSDHFHLSYAFKGLWDAHEGETMLDYGCGPGHDVTGFLVYAKPAKVYAIDVSHKALSLAGHNVGLHKIPADRLSLIQTTDLSDKIPLADGSIDYVHSMGVLHHTSNPESILREFHRILKPNGRGAIMMYNRDSLCFHLYAAYVRMIVEQAYPGADVDDVFRRSTDGADCPISRCHQHPEVCAMAQNAGFEVEYVGGFIASNEIDLWNMYAGQALRDPRLKDPHKSFLRELQWDDKGWPMYRGKYAGVGGTYRLKKR
jgi:ubiquinone/menaquinone biosynthesis C-methylase UbiE